MKNDGGLVYPGSRRESIGKEVGFESRLVNYPGITRRNKLIDDLVVGMVAVIISEVDITKDTAEDVQTAFNESIKQACKIADATIAESNK